MAFTSGVRQPRAIVRINGQPLSGWETLEIEENSFAQPDTSRVEFAIGALPSGQGVDWFAAQTDLEIEILAGFPSDPTSFSASDLTSLHSGRVDTVDVQWEQGLLVLSGRDHTADLLDAKTSEKFVNMTASQVATTLAQRHGLTPVVKPTTQKVGRYYQIDHVALQDDRPEWDLLTWLAREEDYVVYVRGKELHFQPADSQRSTYTLNVDRTAGLAGEFVTLKTTRELTIAKDISVTVRSWNAKAKKAYSTKATRYKSGGKNVQQYSYTIGGLTPEQAQLRANQLLSELSKHEMKLTWTAPADAALTMASLIQLQGTGTAFDQTYYPDTITRSMSVSAGFVMTVAAKNHSPQSEPSL